MNSAQALWLEPDYAPWGIDKYLDFSISNEYNQSCLYPRFWYEDGERCIARPPSLGLADRMQSPRRRPRYRRRLLCVRVRSVRHDRSLRRLSRLASSDHFVCQRARSAARMDAARRREAQGLWLSRYLGALYLRAPLFGLPSLRCSTSTASVSTRRFRSPLTILPNGSQRLGNALERWARTRASHFQAPFCWSDMTRAELLHLRRGHLGRDLRRSLLRSGTNAGTATAWLSRSDQYDHRKERL